MPGDLDHLKDDQIKALSQTLRHLIDHIAGRIEYAESRRSAIASIAAAILAGNIALLTVIQNQVTYLPLWISIIGFSSYGIVLSLVIWVAYARQTNFDYPFKKVTKTWKWFYRDALSNPDALGVKLFSATNSSAQVRKAFEDQQETFRKQNIEGLTDARVSVDQDLQQLYLLHVNEFYKNQFLSQLRNLLWYGLVSNVLFGCMVFFTALFSAKYWLP